MKNEVCAVESAGSLGLKCMEPGALCIIISQVLFSVFDLTGILLFSLLYLVSRWHRQFLR